MAKLTSHLGAYVAFLSWENGKLLLIQREETESMLKGVSFRGCWELPGAQVKGANILRYNYLAQTAFNGAEEKTGIHIPPNAWPFLGPWYCPMHDSGKDYDVGMVLPFPTNLKPSKGTTVWVSPSQLEVLAVKFISETDAKQKGSSQGDGLVSGWGKRMCCMALSALKHSPHSEYARQANQMLNEIQQNLSN